jgi:prepilin-type N-terminal cleavage/methylation domain-containing protein
MPRSDSRLPPRCADVRRRAAGFTLLELMMVLVLAAILLGVGGPSFQDSLQRNRQQSTFNRVASAMSLARSEAVIRSQPVSVCPTTDNASCGGSNWETGWLIFVDNGEGTGGAALDGTLNGTEELLRIGEPAPAGVTIRTVNLVSQVLQMSSSWTQGDRLAGVVQGLAQAPSSCAMPEAMLMPLRWSCRCRGKCVEPSILTQAVS